ncbi:hypothetical protein [Flavobacterium sp. 83]|uniref:hypothetical protein n=1 Tax=Flavobacterium sp. 83 TaxID=1131812 RepID=UPI001EE7384C|nr:hypothetical protein [Flavobacterium sp. 83]
MNRKLQKELKFKIGEQYGKYEFELDWVTTVLDNNLRYEVYQYIGNDKNTIFDFEVHKILLAYNCDFLAGIFYFIKGDSYSKILSEVQNEFSCTTKIKINVVKKSKNITELFILSHRLSSNSFHI